MRDNNTVYERLMILWTTVWQKRIDLLAWLFLVVAFCDLNNVLIYQSYSKTVQDVTTGGFKHLMSQYITLLLYFNKFKLFLWRFTETNPTLAHTDG